MKRLALTAMALLLTAATPPPPALSPYLHDGHFRPGDYGWLKGAFPEADPADKATMAEFRGWKNRCMAAETARVTAELATLGIADPKLPPAGYHDDPCGEASLAVLDTRRWPSFAAFSADLARARPVVATILWTTRIAERGATPEAPTTAALLVARPTGEQILRTALSWGNGAVEDAPPLSDPVKAIARPLLWLEIRARDHANTAWLADLVTREGWPRRSVVGEGGADRAWLLVQHADDDPVFQLRVLRLMEPLLATHDVSARDYGLLYDRVMLKLTGKQRYGTQFTCANGDWAPLPLEDPARLEAYRNSGDMTTAAENLARIRKEYGPCPPESAGRALPSK